MNNRVGIQSMTAVTPLGLEPEIIWRSIRADQPLTDRGIISALQLSTLRKGAAANAAALGLTFTGGKLESSLSPVTMGLTDTPAHFVSPETPNLDRSIELGTIACLQSLADAGWSRKLCAQSDTALFIATSKGPILRMLDACEALRRVPGNLPPDLAWHVALGPAALQTVLTDLLKPGGPVETHVAACAGSFIAVERAWHGIQRGEFTRAIIVAADASIHPIFEHSFENLGVFARLGQDGKRRCRPFATDADGFVITEAAAAICLSVAQDPQLIIERCWSGADATHLLGLDPQGRSLTRGLRACAAQQPVSFVHAHAAGTQHDQVELAAIRRVCGDGTPVFSHKRWMGHTLGASGLVGLVVSAMCHRQGLLPAGQTIVRPARSITIAQGFGGHIGMCVLAG